MLPRGPSRCVRCGSSEDIAANGHAPPVGEVAQRVARHSYGKLIAFLAARTRDIAGAEDALSEAFVAALDGWAAKGVPVTRRGGFDGRAGGWS